MPVDCQQLQELLQCEKEIQAKRQKYQQQVEEQRNRLAGARAEARQAPSMFQHIDADRETSPSQESSESSSITSQDSFCPVPPPSVAEDPSSAPAAPSEEILRRFAKTVAYSSYSRLCGTSDHSLIYHLFENDLQKKPSSILDPKKMVEIPRTGHNIAFLRQEMNEGTSLFAARMAEARRQTHPEVTTDDQVRRLGPANIPGDSLPIYWIVTLSEQGVVDWEGGCSLARAYRRVFEDFGAEDVHCLVFESEHSFSGVDGEKAYAIE